MDGNVKTIKKKPNPRERANLFSIFTFFYTLPLFCLGNKKEITEDDLYETYSGHKSSMLGHKALCLWKTEIESAKKTKRKPSLFNILVKLFWWDFSLIGIGVVIEHLIAQPCKALLLGGLVGYYAERKSGNDDDYSSLAYSFGIIGTGLISCLVFQPFLMASYSMAIKIRVVLSALIYNKILKLSSASTRKLTPGHIVSLLAVDVNAFERLGFLVQILCIGPIQAILSLYLMWSQIGVSSAFGFGFQVIFVPIYVQLGKVLKKYRMKVSTRRDERIRLTDELIQGINVIKLYAWEVPFAKVISKFRKLEINSILKSNYIKAMFTFNETIVTMSIFITITSSIFFQKDFESKPVLVTMNLLSSLGRFLTSFMPFGIFAVAEAKISLRRISNFLLSEEIGSPAESDDSDLAVIISNGYAEWDEDQSTLTSLNLKIKHGGLTALVGTVGSGKSSLCQVIQGELPLCKGKLYVNGSLSFAAQEPWIFAGSVRQNILFGCEMEEERYKKVIECCALNADLKLFPYGDRTSVGEHGASLSGGQKARISLARCVYRKADIYLLDDPLSAVDARVGKHIFENCIQMFLKEKTVILVTHQLQYLPQVDYVIALDNGTVQHQNSDNGLEKSTFDTLKLLNQNDSSQSEPDAKFDDTVDDDPKLVEEERGSGFISISTYKNYIFASKNYTLVAVTILLFLCAELGVSGSSYFIGYWLKLKEAGRIGNKPMDESVYVYTYCGIAATVLILAILRLVAFINLTMASSKALHDSMFSRLLHCSLDFFTTNTSGRILNRFSKDLLSMDEVLPNVAVIAILAVLSATGLLLVICAVNPWFIVPATLVVTVLFFVRRFYLRTNLGILRVEGVVRSPLYGHVQSTLQGLSTIRIFEVQKTLTKEFNNYLDTHSSALQMSYSASRAFGYWIDLLSFLFVSTTIIFYTIKGETYGSNIGIVITQGLNLIGLLPWGMRHLTDVENCMVSVERVLEYNTIKKERDVNSLPNRKPRSTWPSKGGIKFKNVYLKYTSTSTFVLKNVNFVIDPLQKIGIVGRTGAGKSSIIAALFQLVDIEGSIIIDGIDITTIGLHDLRKKMSIIPQDPVLFSGTVRRNLDPFDEFDDGTLWSALENVKLKEIIDRLPLGLSSLVSPDGSNFSVGQRQLLCMARAIVRKNKILVLDEATANVDLETDEIIQETIRTKFENCTVLTIAHRINTIIDSDKIIVMSSGQVVEFNHPYKLLENKNGVFYSMLHQLEASTANGLMDAAREAYMRKMQD